MIYRRSIRVEFNHCDPAGIVFYPRYFEMCNSVVENFFRDIVRRPFEDMMARREGVPTARIETNFHAPSRLGDGLDWQLSVKRIGTSALDLALDATCNDESRLSATLTLVYVSATGRPQPWSQSALNHISEFMEIK
ncbi:acyl-CoA thioesterase [Pararhizobium sp. YC-54]|uniref:acyl-CoA thioesterase n=1 Tax=Pararhizobium sp. YC-54 TaxID=2986920 RepID=UPI0021F7C5DC|nr:thioesterase family protein [Pararhizobium sp. YC-54]MCV9999270.1 acyl-CoA thioesterase [Pararhizobium sp. YC-54]